MQAFLCQCVTHEGSSISSMGTVRDDASKMKTGPHLGMRSFHHPSFSIRVQRDQGYTARLAGRASSRSNGGLRTNHDGVDIDASFKRLQRAASSHSKNQSRRVGAESDSTPGHTQNEDQSPLGMHSDSGVRYALVSLPISLWTWRPFRRFPHLLNPWSNPLR
jgi:hypothetical protein